MLGALQNARRTKDARETLTPGGILCQNARRPRRMLGADQYFTLFTLFVNISIFLKQLQLQSNSFNYFTSISILSQRNDTYF